MSIIAESFNRQEKDCRQSTSIDINLEKLINTLENRNKELILFVLHREFSNLLEGKVYGIYDLVDLLQMISEKHGQTRVDEIIHVTKAGLVPYEHFKWISNNERFKLWFWNYFECKNIFDGQKNFILEEFRGNYFERILKSIDCYYTSEVRLDQPYGIDKLIKIENKQIKLYTYQKYIYMTNAKKLYLKNEVKDKYFSWIDEKDIKQLNWIINYLEKSRVLLTPSDYLVDNVDIKIAQIKASIDAIDMFGEYSFTSDLSPTKLQFINSMRRAWSQKKFRDNGKTKKPYHLPLTKKTKARLEKMAQVQGLSETAILDILINRFYELDYVDIDGKDLY